jgi:protein-tyrosine phosphatase
MRKVSVLFVCLGNICSSPLAEGILKSKIKQQSLESSVHVDSCGTSNYHIGASPDPRTIANAIKNGIQLEHCCRQLSNDDFENFDLILAMDNSNFNNIMKLPGGSKYSGKIKLMREFDPLGKGEVPDPYFGGEDGFQLVFNILDRTTDSLLEYLIKQYQINDRNS